MSAGLQPIGPDISIDMTEPRRAPKGSAKTAEGIFVKVAPEIREAYARAAAERGITKRRLVEAAIARELADPTVFAEDEGQLVLSITKEESTSAA